MPLVSMIYLPEGLSIGTSCEKSQTVGVGTGAAGGRRAVMSRGGRQERGSKGRSGGGEGAEREQEGAEGRSGWRRSP